MKKKLFIMLMITATLVNFGMARKGQYDEEARLQENAQKQSDQSLPAEKHNAAKNFATGVKEITVDNVKDTVGDTAQGTISHRPVVGTLDGAQQAGDKVVDNTIKGVKKVVSLGYAKDDNYEVQEAEKGSGDAAKIKLFQF